MARPGGMENAPCLADLGQAGGHLGMWPPSSLLPEVRLLVKDVWVGTGCPELAPGSSRRVGTGQGEAGTRGG